MSEKTEALWDKLEKTARELDQHIAKAHAVVKQADSITNLQTELSRLEAENKRLREALTPSEDTKAAYNGEFSVVVTDYDDEGNEFGYLSLIPWTTIKEIMTAILKQAEAQEAAK